MVVLMNRYCTMCKDKAHLLTERNFLKQCTRAGRQIGLAKSLGCGTAKEQGAGEVFALSNHYQVKTAERIKYVQLSICPAEASMQHSQT